MLGTSLACTVPLLDRMDRSSAHSNTKTFMFLLLLMGLGFVSLLKFMPCTCSGGLQRQTIEELLATADEEDKVVETSKAAFGPAQPQDSPFLEDLTCPLCCDILHEPLALSCGHVFCRLCVALTLKRSAKKCPTCRAECHIEKPLTQPEIGLIGNLCQRYFPAEYAAKAKEAKKQIEKLKRVHPIIFFRTQKFPGASMALRISEPRHKYMIRRITSADNVFVWLPSFEQNPTAEVGQIGLLCSIEFCEFDLNLCVMVQIKCHRRIIVTNSWVEHGAHNLSFAEYDLFSEAEESRNVAESARIQFENNTYNIVSEWVRQRHIPVVPPPIEALDKAVWWCANVMSEIGVLYKEQGMELMRRETLKDRVAFINNIILMVLPAPRIRRWLDCVLQNGDSNLSAVPHKRNV